MADHFRNGWPASTGIGGRDGPEYASCADEDLNNGKTRFARPDFRQLQKEGDLAHEAYEGARNWPNVVTSLGLREFKAIPRVRSSAGLYPLRGGRDLRSESVSFGG